MRSLFLSFSYIVSLFGAFTYWHHGIVYNKNARSHALGAKLIGLRATA